MIRFFKRLKKINKFKIPTFLGLGIILVGIIAGVFLVVRVQNFTSEAIANFSPKDITLSNIDETSATISWETTEPAYSLVSYSESFQEKTAVDERDDEKPNLYTLHYVKLKKLLPQTAYHFRIISQNFQSQILTFKTATPQTAQNNFGPIIGSVLDGGKSLEEGIVYLTIPGAVTQSAPVKNSGNFLIPVSSMRKSDLSDIYPLTDETIAKLTVISGNNQAQASFKLSPQGTTLPTLTLGKDVDLTAPPLEATPQAQESPTTEELVVFDLNGDGSINAADNAIVLKNFGKSPTNIRTDLNGDGVVNQEDLTLMADKINSLVIK